MVTEATWAEKVKATYELTKDKAAKIGGAVLVGAGVFASTACGGGSEAAPADVENVAAAEVIHSGGHSSEVVAGEACNEVADKYTRGQIVSLTGDAAYETKDALLSSKFNLKDGTKGSSTSTGIELTEAQADQLWESYQASLADVPENGATYDLAHVNVVAYGEEILGSNGTDAKLNVSNVCASLVSVHGYAHLSK